MVATPIPDDPQHIFNARLESVDQSPWLGQIATLPYRQRGRVERVYTTPYGVEVALVSVGAPGRGSLRLEVTELLSTSDMSALRRAEYLRNRRRLMTLTPDGTARAAKAFWRRASLFRHYVRAIQYVENALLEQVKPGDELVYCTGVRVHVIDPEVERAPLYGWRVRMQVQAADEYRPTVERWGWVDGEGEIFFHHDGEAGILPTLGLI